MISTSPANELGEVDLECETGLTIDEERFQVPGCGTFASGGLSEVSCENCTHTAIAAKKKGCYTQRDSGGVWTTPEMSGQGSHWDTKGMYEGENTAVI